jgi:glyoxylase-like metal-dependent hydrolase (beta-lactamase superfamily II)
MSKPVFEEVLPQLFRAEIPLPKNPLKAVNSYIIKDKERNLVIDTGMNLEECHMAMMAVLKELQIELRRTDFYITHLHVDHLGLVGRLALPSSRIYFNSPDAEIVALTNVWEFLFQAAARYGFPQKELKDALARHPANRYSATGPFNFKLLREGDRLAYGSYEFTCIHTPGHTPGHLCLYEPSRKLFVSGDHILGDITPNISAWNDAENPLQVYLQSLDKVYRMELDLILPGHRRIVSDCRGRILDLKKHHEERLQEVLSIIKTAGPGSAYEVAAQMEWDIDTRGWEQFPLTQKWFAMGEAVAHIRYLEETGAVRRKERSGTVIFQVSS